MLGKPLPREGEDFIRKNAMKFQQIIKKDEAQPLRFFAVKVDYFSNLIDSILKELWQYSQYRSIPQELGKVKFVEDYFIDPSCQLLLFKDWVVAPNDPTIQFSILQNCHSSPLAGYPGREKTLKCFKNDFHSSRITIFHPVESSQKLLIKRSLDYSSLLQFQIFLGFVSQWTLSLNFLCPILLTQFWL
ncbi:hypothetical protein O181_022467 [Austropuccinia psidii MF-1]|uniref:Uncharacterized protein n=1 Tax=Austropuccinia psidii MF-1 TaxID=1389203 RepID=A0A9Q3CFI3_9BASI|nr:hypothetical protein [Austropuccinia psidii MF-1]